MTNPPIFRVTIYTDDGRKIPTAKATAVHVEPVKFPGEGISVYPSPRFTHAFRIGMNEDPNVQLLMQPVTAHSFVLMRTPRGWHVKDCPQTGLRFATEPRDSSCPWDEQINPKPGSTPPHEG